MTAGLPKREQTIGLYASAYSFFMEMKNMVRELNKLLYNA
jgi:hypothetical protein